MRHLQKTKRCCCKKCPCDKTAQFSVAAAGFLVVGALLAWILSKKS